MDEWSMAGALWSATAYYMMGKNIQGQLLPAVAVVAVAVFGKSFTFPTSD